MTPDQQADHHDQENGELWPPHFDTLTTQLHEHGWETSIRPARPTNGHQTRLRATRPDGTIMVITARLKPNGDWPARRRHAYLQVPDGRWYRFDSVGVAAEYIPIHAGVPARTQRLQQAPEGEPRTRRPPRDCACGKTSFPSEEAARAAVFKLMVSKGTRGRTAVQGSVYECPDRPGGWHMTRRPARRPTTVTDR